MKSPSSLLTLTLLTTASVCVSGLVVTKPKIVPDNSGECLGPTTPPKGAICGVPGKLGKPQKGASTYKAFDDHECAQRCYQNPSAPCKAFGIIFSKNNVTPGTCTIYTETLTQMTFKRTNDTQTDFYAASCYTKSSTDDTPVVDGSFSNEQSSGPWDTSGLAYARGSSPVSDYGTMETSSHSNSGFQTASISQTLSTCPGNTYQLKYDEGNEFYAGSGFQNSTFKIQANGVTLFTKTNSDGTTAARAPVYFSPSESSVVLAFVLDTPIEDPQTNAMAFEAIESIVAQAVFRGSLPSGTTVTQV